MSMRAGHIMRHKDETGVSGTGRVAEWIEYSDGFVVVRWLSNMASTNMYQNMKQAEQIHGHEGRTVFIVDWEEPPPAPPEPEESEEDTEEEGEPSLEDLEEEDPEEEVEEEEPVEDDSEEPEKTPRKKKTTSRKAPNGKEKK